MKRFSSIILATSLLAYPAMALEITNLDSIEHRVLFEVAGSREVRSVAPGRTEFFIGQPNGFVSLLSAKNPKIAKGALQSDGLLSNYIGNGRTSGMPAEGRDVFVIWPNGDFGIQQRRRGGKYGG